MTPAARLSAAIEVFAEIEARRRPAADALKDWGLSHRFAGSSDRAAIAGLVYDALRRKASSAWLMGEASPRAALIGMLQRERGLDVAAIESLCSGARFAPALLTEAEKAALASNSLADAPAAVVGDYPDWLDPHFARVFGEERAAECAALATRAPLDLRVNTLKARARGCFAEACASKGRADQVVAGRDAHSAFGGCQKPGYPRRAAVSQGRDRNPGRGLAARRAIGRRQARRAGCRSGGRRRRQDAGARRCDGESRPDLRNRYRQAPAGADPRAHRASRCPQYPGAHSAGAASRSLPRKRGRVRVGAR